MPTLDERLARVQKGTLEERLARAQKGTLEERLAKLQQAPTVLTHDGFAALRNADGSISTELSITVTETGLNNGKPTNIPSLWERKVLPQAEAVKKAIASGRNFPAFNSINEAVQAAIARSNKGGASADVKSLEQRLAKARAANPLELNRRNPFTGELNRRESEGPETAGSAFIKTTGRGVANLALGFPQASGTALAFTAALPALVPGGESFREQFETEKGRFPASLLRKIPAPTFEGIFGIEEEAARMRERFPKATGAGDVAADVITLVTGRLPLAKAINKAETKLAGKAPDLLFGGAIPKITDPGVKRLVQRVIDSKSMRSLARGAGRSVEAGFEAAALDLLKGDDPLETAGWVAGAQAGGSVLLSISKGLISGGPLRIGSKLALSAVSAGAIIQLAKNTLPGGRDSLIVSIESGFEKVMYALALSAVAGAVGTGRLRGHKITEDMPLLMDAITAIPRASMISILEDVFDAGPAEQQTIELVINKLAEDPDFFGKGAMAKLQSAITNNRFAEELRALQKDRTFKQKLFSLAPPKHLFPEQRQ